MTTTVAVYAAVIATGGLGWQVWTYWARLRENVGMTQAEAAEAVEIRAQFVSEIEPATRGVSWTTLRALLRPLARLWCAARGSRKAA